MTLRSNSPASFIFVSAGMYIIQERFKGVEINISWRRMFRFDETRGLVHNSEEKIPSALKLWWSFIIKASSGHSSVEMWPQLM